MTGLNHEFGRELLWREYPTDQRGSYFRQFWDVKGIITDDSDLTPEKRAELADTYKDIVPMDTWTSELEARCASQSASGRRVGSSCCSCAASC